ncbi:DNA repair protein RadA [Natronospora cellulosivora (SeqCode)]
MARNIKSYICQECSYKSSKWMGRCPSCDSWNTFKEEKNTTESKRIDIRTDACPITDVDSGERLRYKTDIHELDRVLGGGIVSGSLVLLGGAPGIGKSTLILQAASLFSKKYQKVLYVSGEESASQIKMRADRLDVLNQELYVLAETDFEEIYIHLYKGSYNLVIIDSIQTIQDSKINSSPGSITQVKELTGRLMKIAKEKNVPIILIGHVTKEGELAGPKILEHLVDTVLQFEGDRNYAYRLLRAVKNRYGSTNEVGVFEMRDKGMVEVSNPSQLFLQERPKDVSGSVIVPVIEGSRPLLVEVQALSSTSTFSSPQRLTTGVDYKRVSILLAVLEKKIGINFQNRDVHLNITGGFRVDEPALDLGIVTAVVSSHLDIPMPANMAVFGELGLAGEVRAVSNIGQRVRELKKMGFKKIVVPRGNMKGLSFDPEINLIAIDSVHKLLKLIKGVG